MLNLHLSLRRPSLLLLASATLLAAATPTVQAQDCNVNGIPDDVDLNSGFSADCNADGKPDECNRHFSVSTIDTISAASVFAIDLDGDGDKDVLSAFSSADKIAWYENVGGAGAFGPQQVITTLTDGAGSVFAADLDGDGDNDVLSASQFDDKIAWYENIDGAGAFGPQQVISTLGNGASSVFAADLNGDGDIDVLSASYDDNEIAWYENVDGAGTFGPQQLITTLAFGASSIFAIDIDGDGDNDVVSASCGDDKVAWYENEDGAGAFGPTQVITTQANCARSVYAADIDGDGDNDVLSAFTNDAKIAWHENENGGGAFGPEQVLTTSTTFAPQSVFAADLDGDGDNDVLSPSGWYENEDGAGAFGPKQVIAGVTCVFAADLDGDEDSDVLTSAVGAGGVVWHENEAGVAFAPQQTVTTTVFEVASAFAADLDGDNDNDLVIVGYLEVAWHENEDGAGAFGPAQIIFGNLHDGSSVFAIDLDGDDDNDVLSASHQDGTIAWYENEDGAGAFGPLQSITHSSVAHDVFAADLDGDGDNDVLFTSYGFSPKVGWCENLNGSDAFGPQQIIATPTNGGNTVRAADLDGDGDNDVLYATWGEIAWQKNMDGAGVFGPPQVLAPAANAAIAADLDGDGDNDVLSASGDITWHQNVDGAGTFGPQQTITTFAANSIFAADLDGDDDTDVLSMLDNQLAWFENVNGLGTFGSLQAFSTSLFGLPESSTFAADLNGDGHNDALASSGTVAWFPFCYLDCNANGIPDDLDLDRCEPSADPGCGDCDLNLIPDACDIEGQRSDDLDGNGVPDECQICAAACADQNGDGIRDEACAWHECLGGACVTLDKATPADIGEQSGACAPDGACDAGDRFHALNCFADQSTLGAAPYPCEFQPPAALNVDAGGPGSCALDGVCDASDAFHALNCFSNLDFQGQQGYPCTCSGPAPDPGDLAGVARGQASLILRAPSSVQPGEFIDVDVHLASDLDALRGYQLHLGASGGKSGALELVDISIGEMNVFAPAGAGLKPAPPIGPRATAHAPDGTSAAYWSAFNARTHQMVAGLDDPEGMPAAAGAYLATFTYRVPADAAGTFTIDILHDDGSRASSPPKQRTFLFGRYGSLIEVSSTTPARVTVSSDHERSGPARAR
jgi:hypothetical protein